MKRNLKDFFSTKALRQIPHVPLIIWKIKNWPTFLGNYAGILHSNPVYRFRNGTHIKTGEGVDTATIMVVFMHHDYEEAKSGSLVIDIGANIGAYAIFITSTSKDTVVYAFEPEPKNFALLKENIALNKLEHRVFAFNVAVAGKSGKRELFLSDSASHSFIGNDRTRPMQVECRSLADIFTEQSIAHCDVLKMDCEGAEFEIIYGTPQNVFNKIDVIEMEYHTYLRPDHDVKALVQFLEACGYVIKRRVDGVSMGNLLLERTAA